MYFFTPLWRLPENVPGIAIFSIPHLAWLFCALLFCFGAVRFCRKRRERFLRGAAFTMVLSELLRMALLLAQGCFSPAVSLPLHLCGIMIFVECWAVYRRSAFAMELCWSLGLPGALCALVTPGEVGYPFWNFYYLQFILVHTLLFLIPLLFAAEGFRPHMRQLPKCFLFLVLLAWADGIVNRLLGGNYLFLSQAPAGSLLEAIERFAGTWYVPAVALGVWVFWGLYYGASAFFGVLQKKRAMAGNP